MTTNILEGFTHIDAWAEAHEMCRKTAQRYCGQPDGIPHVYFGGKLYIGPHEEARAWLMSRVRRPNPRST